MATASSACTPRPRSRAAQSSSRTGAAGARTSSCTGRFAPESRRRATPRSPFRLRFLRATAILGLYVPLYPDARERFQLAVDFLRAKGYRNIAIVSHSLGATMANQYLIRTEDKSVGAW